MAGNGDRLTREKYAIDARALAEQLLGRVLVRITNSGDRLSGIITETEAYLGEVDRASHAYRGRRTERTEPMYAKPGTSYVYFTYGMHHCFNVACSQEGVPHAVLVRAIRPTEGIEFMRAARGKVGRRDLEARLCAGPARLCQALGIDRALNAVDLVTHDRLWIEEAPAHVPSTLPKRVVASRRIGVDYAGAWASRRLRFVIAGDPSVSVPVQGAMKRASRGRG